MPKILKILMSLCLIIFLFFSASNRTAEASSLLKKEDNKNVATKTYDEKMLDELLGPEVNFPFRPESHYDNSGPVKRISPFLDNS